MEAWEKFSRWIIGSFAGVIALAIGLIVIFDPYHNIPFSPPLERNFMDNNQRYMFPALARDKEFNSAIFGTSTVRLLRPEKLNGGFDTRFALLALDAGTPWEQTKIGALFLKHHTAPDVILYGVDLNWCQPANSEQPQTARPFPPWMYDENPWNDLKYLLNGKSLEVATRQLRYYFGLDITRYDDDGYEYFLPPDADYDLAKARANIYGQPTPKPIPTASQTKSSGKSSLRFPSHGLFEAFLKTVPAETEIIIVYPPHHASYYAQKISQFDACKSQFTALTKSVRPDALVLDFMLNSRLTRADENYWDRIHYNLSVADDIVGMIIEANRTGLSPNPEIMIIR